MVKDIMKRFSRIIPDKLYLQLKYRFRVGKRLNINNPRTYNEKLQWLKLYDRKPEYTTMVDKYEAKAYVENIIGGGYIIPTFGVWESFDDIDFSMLPCQFILKCTNDSGGLIICMDKSTFDIEAARIKINKCLKNNYYWHGREWPYKNIKPRIIAEKYMVDESGYELKDYKLFCFNGVPKLMLIASDRQVSGEETKFDFFDMQFNNLLFTNGHPNSKHEIQCPKSFAEMKEIATKLSAGLPHVRIDLYDVNGLVYFGEITFYHWSGFTPFAPEEWDLKLGCMIELPIDHSMQRIIQN